MSFIDEGKLVSYAGGRRGAIGAVSDPELRAQLLGYRRDVAKRYRVIDHAHLDKVLPPGALTISAKLDGELWFLVKRTGVTALVAYNGRVLRDTPLVKAFEAKLAAVPEAVVAGELVARPDEGRPRVQHVAAALHQESLESTLDFRPFDLLTEGGQDAQQLPYGRRFERIKALFGETGRTGVVTTVQGDAAGVLSYWREWVQAGRFEGLVVRSEQGLTYKLKPHFTVDAVVVAFGTRITAGVAQVRELNLALKRDDGHFQLIGPVGGGFSDEDRVTWHARLAALEVPSRFRMANRDGTLCRFVRPEIVVEVKVTDLIETDSNDAPVHRMTLSYDPEKGYDARHDARTPALLFPVFQRERPDKSVDVASVGLEQLTSRLASATDPTEAPTELPDSEVLLRRVWTKGTAAVRKVVLIATHKEQRHGFAPFAIFGTDYSGGRAEPLKTTLRTASTRERADAQVAAWIEENVKKGWAEVGVAAPAAAPPSAPTKRAKKSEAVPAVSPESTSEAVPKDVPAPAKKPRAKKAKVEEAG